MNQSNDQPKPLTMLLLCIPLVTLSGCADDPETDIVAPPQYPAVPGMVSPTTGSMDVSTSPTLIWNTSAGAASYSVQLTIKMPSSIIPMYHVIVDLTGLTDTTYQPALLSFGTRYEWRVGAMNERGEGRFSGWWEFKTITTCSATAVEYGGRTYRTVGLGNQCWLEENLDIGVMIDSLQEAADNNIIEKYCYENDPENCAIYGGLYQWNELMQFTTTPGGQGICPPGWHIPTREEFAILDTTVGIHFGTGGFAALLGGVRTVDGSFARGPEDHYDPLQTPRAEFWSSTRSAPETGISADLGGILGWSLRITGTNIGAGLSVRCLED